MTNIVSLAPRRQVLGVLCVVALGVMLSLPATAATSKTKIGTVCDKSGAVARTGVGQLTCAKTSKGLRWVAVSKAGKSTPVDSSSATRASTTPRAATSTKGAAVTDSSPQTTAIGAGAVKRGELRGLGGEKASGRVEVSTVDGVAEIRLLGSQIDNGPELVLYASTSAGLVKATGSTKIGPLTAFSGDHRYRLPASLAPADVKSILIWCDRFSVPFATADLQ